MRCRGSQAASTTVVLHYRGPESNGCSAVPIQGQTLKGSGRAADRCQVRDVWKCRFYYVEESAASTVGKVGQEERPRKPEAKRAKALPSATPILSGMLPKSVPAYGMALPTSLEAIGQLLG